MKTLQFIHKDKDKLLFFSTLRSRVDNYFKENKISKNYNSNMVIKTIVILALYTIPFLYILFFSTSSLQTILLFLLMGVALAGIGMSIMHDANHGSYSNNSKINFWLGHTLNLLGGAVFNWKLQHNILHHTYTNVTHYDDDIEDKLIMRFSPHTKVKWYHKLQHYYVFLFYSILTLYWVIFKDFVQFSKYTKSGVNKSNAKQNVVIFIKILLSKLFYITTFIIVPLYVLEVTTSHYIIGFILMHLVAGLILSVTFQLAHTVEQTSHPMPNENGTIENTWAIHQLNTTVNFSRKNKFISWYVGGLNFQVEHHLFPSICHVHYPALAPIVKQTAEEFGVPYLENETLYQAFKSHLNTLKRFGKPEVV